MDQITFWKLFNKYSIIIPIIQRDYSQGRTSGKFSKEIKEIREKIVKDLVEAVKSKNELMLNFVYGKTERLSNTDGFDDPIFIPVDGQQRLTTLYLFHWYIFSKADRPLKKPFLYKSRKTTETFCKKISENPRLAKQDISLIKKEIWFSHSLECDPSVRSMITVLQTIEREISFEKLDYNSAADYLQSDECKIKFCHLELQEFDDEDLYIKMNSRGKRLSDFDVFKAELQDSKALKCACKDDDEEVVKYIGRFNNEYCNLFYGLDNQNFDKMMMQFIEDTIKCEHYITAIENGKTDKEYRGDYNNDIIYEMTGRTFFDNYVDNPLEHLSKDAPQDTPITKQFENSYHKDSIIRSIKKMDFVLGYLTCNDELFNYEPLKENQKITKSNLLSLDYLSNSKLKRDAIRYGVCEFIFLMDPKNNDHFKAYTYWIRFVFNIVDNTDFRSSDISANVLKLFHDILKNLKSVIGDNSYDYKNVLESISKISTLSIASQQIEQKVEEERKAKLMLSSPEWENAIIEAERYYRDGQISFLLDFAGNNIDLFKKYFEISKNVFNDKKESIIKDYLFHQALLSLDDESESKRSYLTKDERTDYSLRWSLSFKEELKNQQSRIFIKKLFGELLSEDDFCRKMHEIIEFRIKNPFVNNAENWKNEMLRSELPKKWNCYNDSERYNNPKIDNYISFVNDNSVVLLLNRKQTGSMNIDLYTFLLYMEIANSNVSLHFYNTTKLVDDDNKPLRYVEKNGKRFGYDYVNKCYVNIDTFDSNQYTIEEAKEFLNQ